MKDTTPWYRKQGWQIAIGMAGVIILFLLLKSPGQDTSAPVDSDRGTNAVSEAVTEADVGTNANENAAAPVEPSASTNQTTAATTPDSSPLPSSDSPGGEPAATAEEEVQAKEIQLSFKGANIDMIIQWLAEQTGKSILKHPKVQCQLTIVSSTKLPPKQAISLVYRALAMEGFTTIESSRAIMLVPEGQEIKMNPELMDAADLEAPDGRQRVVQVFQLVHIKPSLLKERIRGVLSEQVTIEADDRANKLIITEYAENMGLLEELIEELDVVAVTDSIVEIFPLKYAETEDLSGLLNLILNEAGNSGTSNPRPSGPPTQPPDGGGGGTQARFWADKTANRLIVAAPVASMPKIRELIATLDTEKPADVAVRVLPMKHVDAADLVREIGPLYQKMSGTSLKDVVEVTANERSNSLIILSSETNFESITQLINALDTDSAKDQILRTFALKNADAEDVASQLQELSQDSPRNVRYLYMYSSRSQQDSKASFVADRRRNTVIVQAHPSSMENIAEMIKTLDEPVTDDSLAPKIYPLKFISALDIEEVLNELFTEEQQQRNYWDYYYYDSGYQDNNRNVGRLYGKVRITSEPYSNSIIVTANSKESLEAVEQVLKQLDIPSQAGETTLRVSLSFARAVTLANNLNILFARAGSPPLRPVNQPGQPDNQRNQGQSADRFQSSFELDLDTREDVYYSWLGGQQESSRFGGDRTATRPVSDLIGKVRVVPDTRTNSLLITSNVHFLPQVLKLVNELDAPTAQVLIEAKIIEVRSDFRDRLGVRWSPDGSQTFEEEDFDDSLLASGGANYSNRFLGGNLVDSLRTGILDASINLDFLVQFLRKNNDSKVLAEPQINVADNELGKLFVGAQVPFISSSLNTQEGGRNDAFQYRDVGIILEVTPRINNSTEIALKIRVESSNIRSGQTLFGGAILDTRNFRTDLVVKSGQTLVLGGIIQQEDVKVIRKVPFLGDIPGLGYAFKKKDTITRETELMVFLRPRVTMSPEDASQLIQDIDQRLPNIRAWEESLKTEEK